MTAIAAITLIGFGEVGQMLADDLLGRGFTRLAVWDVKFADAESIPSKAVRARNIRVDRSAAEAVRDADLVICAVTAAQDSAAAKAAALGLKPGAYYLDFNSASPGQKAEAAQAVEAAGGRYVEAAVMSPVAPKRLASPILLGGPHAEAFLPIARDVGLTGTRFFSGRIGQASAAKMCRSIMVKGIEALLTESMLSARHYGVEETVLNSLGDLFPGPDWSKLTPYMISRSIEHGVRRAEEMREVAATVGEAGVAPLMSSACAERQDWAAQFKPALETDQLNDMLDAILTRMAAATDGEANT